MRSLTRGSTAPGGLSLMGRHRNIAAPVLSHPPLPPGLDALADEPSLAPRGVIAGGRALGLGAAATLALGGATLAWGQVERRLPTVRHVRVPVAALRGVGELRVLQISDLHLYPGQEFLVDFLTRVARTEPLDMVVSTGDSFGSADGLPLVRAAYAPFAGLPGAFVLGSNDYYSPRQRNWAHYLRRDPRLADDAPSVRWSDTRVRDGVDPTASTARIPHLLDRGHETDTPDLPWTTMVRDFARAGWVDLSNRSGVVEVPLTNGRANGAPTTQRVSLIGVDDPHLGRDRMPSPDPSWAESSSLRLAVTHSPYIRVLDAFTHLHPDVMIAGHTHGGQIGLPVFGALVTNCDLPRRFAKGLHLWTAGHDRAPLYVSSGLGTSPFAPVRVATRPDVTLIHLMPV